MSEVTVSPMDMPLTALDRCDRCGAQAYVRAFPIEGLDLLFCAHHWRDHGGDLREKAFHIHDETEKLEAPAVST